MLLILKMNFNTMRTIRIFSKPALTATLFALFIMLVPILHAQQDRRDKIENMHTAYITEKINLTPDQAKRFWPVYDQYIAEQTKIHDQKYAVIKEFATSWGTISDAQAEDLTNRALAVDAQVTQLRIKYMPSFLKVLPGKQVATFFQIDRRLQMMVDLQLMSELPLVQSQ